MVSYMNSVWGGCLPGSIVEMKGNCLIVCFATVFNHKGHMLWSICIGYRKSYLLSLGWNVSFTISLFVLFSFFMMSVRVLLTNF